jgi:plastocyanin
MLAVRICLACSVLVACSSDGGGTPDAKQIDAPANSFVVAVTCPATPALTVSGVQGQDTKYSYAPMSGTITQGQIVKFTMSVDHDVNPAAMGGDPNLKVGKGMEKCFMFTQTGTYKFFCNPHGFAGMVVVN